MKNLLAGIVTAICMGIFPAASADDSNQRSAPASIGLALGSGGAGGLAHIAMLQVLDELQVKPDRIVGSSIGAVIGALYAAGLSAEQIHDIFDDFGGSSLDALTQLMDPSSELSLGALLKIDIDNGGLFDSSGFLDFIAGKVDATTFDDLGIPLEVVATDYWSGDSVVLSEGDLFEAIKASMAVPGLFSPVKRGEQLLIDGGMSNPLPYDLLADRYDLVIAIDVSGSRTPVEGENTEMMELLFSAFEIMQQSIIAARMRSGQPDVYIKANTNDIRLLQFNRIETILEQAEPAAQELRRRVAGHVGSTQ